MVTCEEVELRLLELFGTDPPQDLTGHLESCPSCREKRDEWAHVWSIMGRWEEDKPSLKLDDSVCSEIRASLHREAATRRRKSWRSIAETVGPLLAATTMALLGVLLAAKRIGPALEPVAPLALLICGITWVVIYNVMFFVSFEKLGVAHRIQGIPAATYARCALVALAIWLLFMALNELSGIGTLTTEFFLPRVSVSRYFLFGLAYSFIPLVSASLFIRGKGLNRASAHGLLLGIVFLFLLAPEIFLYCSSFSLGIAFNWSVGTIVGCVTGGPVEVWLGNKATDGLKA